jgi:CDP-diacylglycerol--serine O-phosphatidyltransferase
VDIAAIVSTFYIFQQSTGWFADEINAVVLVMSFLLALLMVSTIRFPSFKELNWRSRATFGYLMIGVVSLVAIAYRPEMMLFVVLFSYLLMALFWNLWCLVSGKKTQEAAKTTL